MSDESNNQILEMSGMKGRYPKETYLLSQIFAHTTNSYKLAWFLAILSMVNRKTYSCFRLMDIFTEMVVVVWYPVCFYRLSLGRQDKLQDAVMSIKAELKLSANETPEKLRCSLLSSSFAQASIDFLRDYVPTRFLTPWFANELRGMKDYLKDSSIRSMLERNVPYGLQAIYKFVKIDNHEGIKITPEWFNFLKKNNAIVQAFAEYNYAIYLQDRNPNVPGIVKKLHVPSVRQLTAARNFWKMVCKELRNTGHIFEFKDIYADCMIEENFSIDHFLPWSFVVHDMLWNLTPVKRATNSRKSDVIPDIDLYLPRLARLHHRAINVARHRPTFLEDYSECFKQDIAWLVQCSEESLYDKYREIIVPQSQIAINQGFSFGWQF